MLTHAALVVGRSRAQVFCRTRCGVLRYGPPVAPLRSSVLRAMRLDDVLLMQLGFRFLRQVLFGKVRIPMHEQTAQSRRDALNVRRDQPEREAAARRARDEDAANFVDI